MQNKPHIPRYYWDACVFMCIIENEAERLSTIVPMISDSEAKTIEIFTSTLSIAEVAFAEIEKKKKRLDDKVEKQLDETWNNSSVMLMETTASVIYKARDYIREALLKGWALKPHDAIHLASATIMLVDELHTYDEKLYKFAPMTGFKIAPPASNQIPFTN